MAELADLARRGGLLVLAALAESDYLTMAQVQQVSGLTQQPARDLRLVLLGIGLVDVEEIPVRGATELRLRLTPHGREVAKHVVAIRDILERGPPKARR